MAGHPAGAEDGAANRRFPVQKHNRTNRARNGRMREAGRGAARITRRELADHFALFGAGCGPAGQITLHPAALQDPEQGGLIGGFRALADRVQSQCASHSEGQADRFKQSLGHVFRPGDIRAWHAAALTNFYSIFGDVLSIGETLEAFDRRRGG